ncbi:MAG: hypothetical protein N4A31_05600 [Rickettsiales bacterium]|jgi:hypothetical protein|nr:hypothetical protein [Rickettsiales bacterium]
MNYPVSAQNHITVSSSVPETFMAHLAAEKANNKSNYQIDDVDVREFVGECWKLLSPEERKHYRDQLDNPELTLSSGPTIKKLAFDLNRGLMSAYNEASKNKTDIYDELDAQVTNFKYVNLSNSDLEKDKKLGLFTNKPFQNRDEFKDQPLLAISMETALSTFPSIERLGYTEAEKSKFIDSTAAILTGLTKDQTILNRGSLDPTLTSSVAAYVDKNFKDLQDLSKEEQVAIGNAFKQEYKKLYAEQEQDNKRQKRAKGYPVEISPTKLANGFERLTVEKKLLKSSDKFVTIDMNTPKPQTKESKRSSSPLEFLRKRFSFSPNQTSSVSTTSATIKANSKDKRQAR